MTAHKPLSIDSNNRITHLKESIAYEAQKNNRLSKDIMLLGVSKGQSIQKISIAYNNGLTNFGENYYQEAVQKIKALSNFDISWHFIGPVQSNKTKGIAEHFQWVHSIDRLKTLECLNRHRPVDLPPLNICLQVNLSKEASKSGVDKAKAIDLLSKIEQFPKLRCRGLMTISSQASNHAKRYQMFLELAELLEKMNQNYSMSLDTLSMGMSDDFKEAIAAGSTIIRVGTALFGKRIQ